MKGNIMPKKDSIQTRRQHLSFTRHSKVEWIDFEERLRSAENLGPEDVALASRLINAGSLIRNPQTMMPMDANLYSVFKFNPGILQLIYALFAGPYTVNFENGLNIPVQFVWAYELWSGLILVDQSTYTQPGNTAVLQYAKCIEMRQYAFSVWDQNDNELGVSPTWTVQYINQVESQQGTFKLCADTIEVS
jgi:hypothetical protein